MAGPWEAKCDYELGRRLLASTWNSPTGMSEPSGKVLAPISGVRTRTGILTRKGRQDLAAKPFTCNQQIGEWPPPVNCHRVEICVQLSPQFLVGLVGTYAPEDAVDSRRVEAHVVFPQTGM